MNKNKGVRCFKIQDLCNSIESEENETIMENKSPVNQQDFSSIKNPSPLIYFYPDPSMSESKAGRESVNCKKLSFVVEWQMYNPSSDNLTTQ